MRKLTQAQSIYQEFMKRKKPRSSLDLPRRQLTLLRLLKFKVELRKMAENWQQAAKAIAQAAEELLGPCSVYVFGSAAKGKLTGGSDVDILIISDSLPSKGKDKCELKAQIEEKARLPAYHPFEIHLANIRDR